VTYREMLGERGWFSMEKRRLRGFLPAYKNP